MAGGGGGEGGEGSWGLGEASRAKAAPPGKRLPRLSKPGQVPQASGSPKPSRPPGAGDQHARGSRPQLGRDPWGRRRAGGVPPGYRGTRVRLRRGAGEQARRHPGAAASDSPAPGPRAPRPGPTHLDQAATLLPQGALRGLGFRGEGGAPQAGTSGDRDFTPPSWDPARYRQPCTSCLKTQGRERARDPSVGRVEGGAQTRAREDTGGLRVA